MGKSMKVKFISAICFLLFGAQFSFAQIPSTISYQGVLKNADGTLVTDNTYSLTFKLYESETGGSEIWSEIQSVSVSTGIFNVILGSVTPFTVSFDKQYWLGISINSDPEASPRIKLSSVPYSLNTLSIPDSIVSTGKIIDGAVTNSKIADTTLTAEKINSSGADSGQALIFNGSDVTWGTPSSTGLVLPYSETTSSSENAFAITDSGSGIGLSISHYGTGSPAHFQILNSSNSSNVLSSIAYGSGKSAQFSIFNSSNNSPAIDVSTSGLGEAGYFSINNSGNANPAIYAFTNGDGSTIKSFNTGNGNAGWFEINNDSNPVSALFVKTNGTGDAINSYTTGTGTAGYFLINYEWSENSALYASTNGIGNAVQGLHTGYEGYAGNFEIQNSSSTGNALHAKTNGSGYAGYFEGNLHVAGTLSKSAGSFVIDHPLDPENKVLRHSFAESPEMMNIYKGRAKLNGGKAVIELPYYFDALNHPEGREINLTCINGWSPLFLEGEIKNNRLTVKTTKDGSPDQEFSWIVYAVRNDSYAKNHPIVVEEEKGNNNNFKKGKYLNPVDYSNKK